MLLMRARGEDGGVYHYFLNDEPMPIKESWQRRQQSPGEWWVSSSREAAGVEIAVEASVVDALVSAFVVIWRSEGSELRAEYTLMADRVRVQRGRSGSAMQSFDISFSSEAPSPLLSPLMRIFAGPLIAELLDRGGVGQVVVPDIVDHEKAETLLSPLISQRSARILQPDAALTSNKAQIPCRVCEYLGDQYGAGTQFWLDENDLLLRYRWQQSPRKLWDVWLQPEGGTN